YVNSIMGFFWNMNKINKTQFPLPYAQIVKLLILIYVFTLPFRIMNKSGPLTTGCITVFATIGFFGLDKVAEVLQSPSGTNPNDINLRRYGRRLLKDLSMIYSNRNMTLDTVFATEESFDLSFIHETYTSKWVDPTRCGSCMTVAGCGAKSQAARHSLAKAHEKVASRGAISNNNSNNCNNNKNNNNDNRNNNDSDSETLVAEAKEEVASYSAKAQPSEADLAAESDQAQMPISRAASQMPISI
ncbi:unnamed protein product, partial [Polarella glacialis]